MTQDRPFGLLFLSVGASKSGTTWLYSVIESHPKLHFTPEKELHYFHYKYANKEILSHERRLRNAKTRVLERIDPVRSNILQVRRKLQFMNAYLDDPLDDTWYANLFLDKPLDAYSCDFSNFYALLPQNAWAEIAEKCEKLKVLFTMRDPIERLWSHIKFHLQMTQQTDMLAKWGPREFREFAQRPFIWDNCEYGKILRKMKAELDTNMLYIQFYEDLFADTGSALTKLETFLEIEPGTYPEEKIKKTVNSSVNRTMPDYFPDIFKLEMSRIAREVEDLGYRLPTCWHVWD